MTTAPTTAPTTVITTEAASSDKFLDRFGKQLAICGALASLIIFPAGGYIVGINSQVSATASKQQADTIRYDTLIQERGPQNAATRAQVDDLRVTVAVVKAQSERTQGDVKDLRGDISEMRGDMKILLQRSAK